MTGNYVFKELTAHAICDKGFPNGIVLEFAVLPALSRSSQASGAAAGRMSWMETELQVLQGIHL